MGKWLLLVVWLVLVSPAHAQFAVSVAFDVERQVKELNLRVKRLEELLGAQCYQIERSVGTGWSKKKETDWQCQTVPIQPIPKP